MPKKKSKTQQSSSAAVNAESSDSNEVNEKAASGSTCPHVAKSVDQTQVLKSLKNCEDLKKNFCPICVKDSKPLKGSDIYVCLKCGTKTCCKEHSLAHFKVPRSDLHALAYDVSSQTVLCYGCPCEINEKDAQVRKLSACVSCVNSRMSSQKEKLINIKLPETNDDNKENVKVTNIKAPAFNKNDKKGEKFVQSAISVAPVRGLSNLGNTCYFNSVMQCLARTQALLSELKEMDHETDIRLELKGGETLKGSLVKWEPMAECLYETLTSLLESGSAFAPSKFLNFVRKKHPQFEGYNQHDAHELLRHTLDSIKMLDLRRYQRIMLDQKGLLKTDPKGVPPEVQKQLKELEHKVTQVQTFIPEKTFKGKLVSRVECQECHHSSEYIEGFLDLSLPILADKPHPPVGRRKGGNIVDELAPDAEESHSPQVLSKKQMRQMKKRNMKMSSYKPPARSDHREGVDEVAAEAHEALVAKQDVPRMLDEEKPHESGYSSEKASSSLRGSPSSEEIRSSSPCDDSWCTLPQFNDSWLSALPGGMQLPIYTKEKLPNLINRPPTRINVLSDGTPDLASLSLHDSNGSILNPLCQDTRSIMDQEPDWRSRIHQDSSRWMHFSSSFEFRNSIEEVKKNDDCSLVKSSVLDNGHEECPSADNLPCDDCKEWTAQNGSADLDSDVSEESPRAKQAENQISQTADQRRSSSGDLGRSLSPPLRKTWAPHLKRDSEFSPVKEEESEALLEGSPPTEDVSNLFPEEINVTFVLKEIKSSREGTPTSCSETDPLKSENTISEHNIRNDSSWRFLNKEPVYYGSCNDKPTHDSLDYDWSSLRESFSRSKDAGSNLREITGAEGDSQAAPNNSLDSNGSDSENDELKIGELVFSEQPNLSTVKHSLPLPDPLASGESLQTVMDQKPCSEEEDGDFEPLLGNLTDSPEVPNVRPEETKQQEEPLDSVPKNSCSKIPCLVKRKDSRDSRDPSECSVESCLRQFTSIEFMTGSNKVGCSACTERQNKGAKDGKTVLTMATKQLLIGQAPPVLILHLKRFQVQLHSVRKLTKHVAFPLVLDLAPFCMSIGEDKNNLSGDSPLLYGLYGIVEHRGTLHSGHYVAYVKVDESNKRRWFCISDSRIDEVTEERVLKTEAYLLFYSKITPSSSS